MALKSNLTKYIDEVLQGFRMNKGKGSIYCFNKSIGKVVHALVKIFVEKNPTSNVFIVSDNYSTRTLIMKELKADRAIDLNKIKILSIDYVNVKYTYKYNLVITVGVVDVAKMIHLRKNTTYMMSFFTSLINNPTLLNNLRSMLPNIETTVSDMAVNTDRIYSPVEEHLTSLTLSDDDRKLYDKYSIHINNTIAIFGDIKNIEKCKNGDPYRNISAAEYRANLANQNGWSNNLDTTIDFQDQIDKAYNPNVLLELALNFFNITRSRIDLVLDNVLKLDKILSICLEHKDKRILIVSRKGEFARKITEYINANSDLKCGDYHDCIPDAYAIDPDTGETLLVKTGKTKGKPKVLKSAKRSSLNLSAFNANTLNVLSIKLSSNVELKTAVDVVIFTSPMKSDIVDFKTRFTAVEISSEPNKVYKVYIRDTFENIQINKLQSTAMITIIKDHEDRVNISGTNSDIILDI